MSFVEESLRSTAEELFATDDRRVSLAQLEELGWSELFAEEPKAAVAVLAEVQGRTRGVSRLLEMVLATQLGGAVALESEGLLIPLRSVAVVSAGDLTDTIVFAGAPIDTVVVPTWKDGAVVLNRGAPTSTTTVSGMDPHAQVERVAGVSITDTVTLGEGAWDRAIALGSLCVAYETLGVVDVMLEMAVEHVTTRHQFGVPIGTFQAVQHRLANVHVERAAARVVADLAWADLDPALCAAALGAARRAFVSARINCHQVFGAIGVTWEHDLHWYVRRGILLDLLLDHRPELARAVDTVVTSRERTDVWS